MLPSADGVHGFVGVQVAVCSYVALVLGITVGLWWLGMPASTGVVAFLIVGAVLLVPFWPLFRRLHPEHSDGT